MRAISHSASVIFLFSTFTRTVTIARLLPSSTDAEVARLSADRIQVTALHLPEPGDRLPNSRAGPHDDGVFRLPEADKQGSRGGIVLDDGGQVLIESGFEAGAVAVVRRGE